MNTLTIGAWHAAELHGIAGPWAVHGYATIWDITTTADGTQHVTVEVSAPGGATDAPHYTYATGRVSILTDGRTALTDVITPQPGPTRIVLSAVPDCLLGDVDAQRHRAQAVSTLTDWQPIPDNDSSLGVSALTHLARAVQRVADGENAVRERDTLIRRLRAGQVDRSQLATIVGTDPSRITQICKPIRERMSA
ncbi:hypothetical protein [Kitasatospora sp. NPDC091276]|uniref:hypothetical protein n=1 Tax=unclassified Kitasatospora TaxID=2633591 RepID=UPI00341FEC05